MRIDHCSSCDKIVLIAIINQVEPHSFSGFFIKCDKTNAYCIFCNNRAYLTVLRNSSKQRIIQEYLKKKG